MRRSTAHIRAQATAVLRNLGVEEPPIPIELLAHRLSAQIIYAPYEGDMSGILFRDADRTIIGVNAQHAKARQRFTIAHEIGHLILHTSKEFYIDRGFAVRLRDETSAQATDVEEIEANTFAAELLMPARMLKRDIGERVLDFEGDDFISELAARYRVSLQAMTFRLTNLGYLKE